MSEPVKRITREELYEAVWSKPIKTLAREWNTTYLRLVEACLEMGVPRPSQGHWQRVALGQPVPRDALPEQAESAPCEVDLLAQGVPQGKKKTSAGTVPVVSVPQQKATGEGIVDAHHPETKAPATQDRGRACDLPQAAERAVLDIIRQATKIDFWKETISECHRPCWLANWLGLDAEVEVSEAKLLSVLKKVRQEYRTFQVKVEEVRDRYYPSDLQLSVEISLREGFEWKDAWEEAWSFAENHRW